MERVMGPRRLALQLLAVVVGVVMGLASVGAQAASAAQAQPAACSQDVTFGLIEATTSGCLNQVAAGQWQTTDTVSLNGVPITPVAGTSLALTAPTASSPGGQLSVQTPGITVSGVTFA
ncbi:MAG: hypothetical protein JO027_10160, partial [Solirubrobacterales bacterium]|nr:hypothetical protein [Solirubrobacterales bacterium]